MSAEINFADPLVATWWGSLDDIARGFYGMFIRVEEGALDALVRAHVDGAGAYFHERTRLRSLILASLTSAQEMREVLKAVEFPHVSHNIGEPVCHFCGGSDPAYEPPPGVTLSKTGHASDCRLARLLKENHA